MNNHFKVILIYLVIGLLSFNTYAGGGWTQPKGDGFFKLSQTVLFGGKYYDENGTVVDVATTGVYLSALYAEYGVTNKFTAILNAPLTYMFVRGSKYPDGTVITEPDTYTGIGDIDIAVKYSLYQSAKVSVAATLLLGIPSGTPSAGDSGILQTGDGEFNQLIQVDAGFPLGKGYANVYIGFNNRTEGFSDEIRWGVEGGYGFGKFYFILRVAAIKSLHNSTIDPLKASSAQGIFSNDLEYISVLPELIYNITDAFGISATYGNAFMAKRILAVPSYNVGIFKKI